MLNPARVGPKVEAAIEETRRILECYVRFEYWKADPDSSLSPDIWTAIKELSGSYLSNRTKNSAQQALFEQTKKRHSKPTRHFRDNALCVAAVNLLAHGYSLTRNEATRHTESASSIIRQALERISPPEKMTEKQINAVLTKYPLAPF